MTKVKTVYFAGKVRNNGDYRDELLGKPCVMSEGNSEYRIYGGRLNYGGPFVVGEIDCYGVPCNYRPQHGGCLDYVVEHRENEHGEDLPHMTTDLRYSEEEVFNRCLGQIDECDALHVYIDEVDCHGTKCEIGYAKGIGKPIYMVISRDLKPGAGEKDELWFVKRFATRWRYGSPRDIFPGLLADDSGEWMGGQ